MPDAEERWEPEVFGEPVRGTLEVERHRPERSFDAAVAAGICCSCCCCCCCCAHAIGATAGAVAGNVRTLAKVSNEPETRRAALMAIGVYWLGVGFVSLVAVVLAMLVEETLLALIGIVILAPGLQLAGTFFALPTILLQPTPEARRAAASAIGSATLGWFVGGLLGGALIALGVFLLLGGAGALSS